MELSEILDLSDRILVMYEGEIVGSFKAGEATTEQLGLLMAGIRETSSPAPKPEVVS
jgi:simple sugar transport system ATP-binding protein